MKKTTISIFAVLMALSITSCVKSYNCECTKNGVVNPVLGRSIGQTTKVLASAQCDVYDNTADTINCYAVLK